MLSRHVHITTSHKDISNTALPIARIKDIIEILKCIFLKITILSKESLFANPVTFVSVLYYVISTS